MLSRQVTWILIGLAIWMIEDQPLDMCLALDPGFGNNGVRVSCKRQLTESVA
jgi:hypothetical protein